MKPQLNIKLANFESKGSQFTVTQPILIEVKNTHAN